MSDGSIIRDVFFRAAEKPAGPSANDMVAAIQEEYPEFRDRNCCVPGYGNIAHTIIFEGKGDEPNFVFKAPKRADDIAAHEEERRRLEHLQGRGLPVPEVTHVGKKYAYFGMKQMPGTTLYEQQSSMTDAELESLGCEVGSFIAEMAKAYPIDRAPEWFHANSVSDPLYGGVYDLERAMKNRIVREVLGDNFPAVERADKEYVAAFSDEAARQKRRIIMHLDLNMGNILVDPQTKRLVGIIDFGLVGPYWPELIQDLYPMPYRKGLCEGCTANGIPAEYRYVLLATFKESMEGLRKKAAHWKSSRASRVRGKAEEVEACLRELASLEPITKPAAVRTASREPSGQKPPSL